MGFKYIEAIGEADKLCAALVRKIKYMEYYRRYGFICIRMSCSI